MNWRICYYNAFHVFLSIYLYMRHDTINLIKIKQEKWSGNVSNGKFCLRVWKIEMFPVALKTFLAKFVILHTHELCDSVRKMFLELLTKSSTMVRFNFKTPEFQFLLFFKINISSIFHSTEIDLSCIQICNHCATNHSKMFSQISSFNEIDREINLLKQNSLI